MLWLRSTGRQSCGLKGVPWRGRGDFSLGISVAGLYEAEGVDTPTYKDRTVYSGIRILSEILTL